MFCSNKTQNIIKKMFKFVLYLMKFHENVSKILVHKLNSPQPKYLFPIILYTYYKYILAKIPKYEAPVRTLLNILNKHIKRIYIYYVY